MTVIVVTGGWAMRVLVTGGAGFIGSNLVARLLRDDIDVTVLDDLSTGRRANLDGLDASLHVGSILDDAALDDVVPSSAAIVHLAALPSVPRSITEPVRSHEVNVTGTMHVLQAARRHGVRHVVVASSSSVYGDQPVPVKHEELAPRPLSPYAVSKLATEQYALAFAQCYGLRVTAFRFFNVYGPGQAADHAYAAVVPSFVDAALAGRPLRVYGDGRQSRDFTFVGSVCEVLQRSVVERVGCHEPVNLANGTRTTLLELVAQLEDVLGHELPVEHLEPRAGDVRHSLAGTDRLSGLFPDLAPVDLRTGLTATVDWFRSSTSTAEPEAAKINGAPAVPASRRPLSLAPRHA